MGIRLWPCSLEFIAVHLMSFMNSSCCLPLASEKTFDYISPSCLWLSVNLLKYGNCLLAVIAETSITLFGITCSLLSLSPLTSCKPHLIHIPRPVLESHHDENRIMTDAAQLRTSSRIFKDQTSATSNTLGRLTSSTPTS